MVPFKNAQESHAHSMKVLDIIYGYDSFLDSLEFVADFGCGTGLDARWWATLMTRDNPPLPRDYKVYAVDRKIGIVSEEIKTIPNLHVFHEDIETISLPRKVDLIWCHDVFQFVVNPMQTLRHWNSLMNENGMLIISMPLSTYSQYNKLQVNSYNHCYYNHNLVNLMYMLAANGFDCNDAYFKKDENDPWLYAAVYKSNVEPLNPLDTSWYKLAEYNLLNDSVVNSLTKFGYVRQDEILVNWLDKDFGLVKE